MIRLLAIDPGSEQSGFVEYDHGAGAILEHGVADNEILLARCWRERDPAVEHHLAIEMIDVFGMAGRTVFETCVWIGRFIEAWAPSTTRRSPATTSRCTCATRSGATTPWCGRR
jgi:hypothetical protein